MELYCGCNEFDPGELDEWREYVGGIFLSDRKYVSMNKQMRKLRKSVAYWRRLCRDFVPQQDTANIPAQLVTDCRTRAEKERDAAWEIVSTKGKRSRPGGQSRDVGAGLMGQRDAAIFRAERAEAEVARLTKERDLMREARDILRSVAEKTNGLRREAESERDAAVAAKERAEGLLSHVKRYHKWAKDNCLWHIEANAQVGLYQMINDMEAYFSTVGRATAQDARSDHIPGAGEMVSEQQAVSKMENDELLQKVQRLEEALSFYARDEERFLASEGEPFGSIPTEIGAFARSVKRDFELQLLAQETSESRAALAEAQGGEE